MAAGPLPQGVTNTEEHRAPAVPSTPSDTRGAAKVATYAMAEAILNRMPWPGDANEPQRLLSREWLLANGLNHFIRDLRQITETSRETRLAKMEQSDA